jgi:hypothetical protein
MAAFLTHRGRRQPARQPHGRHAHLVRHGQPGHEPTPQAGRGQTLGDGADVLATQSYDPCGDPELVKRQMA